MRALTCLAAALLLTACAAPERELQFVPSTKSALQLRVAQLRTVPGEPDQVMRGVIATLHDLGYRITKAEPSAGTVSATRRTALRMAVAVRPGAPGVSVVRANATIVTLSQEAQVDSAEFYRRDFFEPLGMTLQRELAEAPETMPAPDAVRPVGELNTASQRAAARSPGPAPSNGTPKP